MMRLLELLNRAKIAVTNQETSIPFKIQSILWNET